MAAGSSDDQPAASAANDSTEKSSTGRKVRYCRNWKMPGMRRLDCISVKFLWYLSCVSLTLHLCQRQMVLWEESREPRRPPRTNSKNLQSRSKGLKGSDDFFLLLNRITFNRDEFWMLNHYWEPIWHCEENSFCRACFFPGRRSRVETSLSFRISPLQTRMLTFRLPSVTTT